MALTPPSKVYDFTSNAALGLPVPGDRVDAQFLNHRDAIVATQARLNGITRDDGKIANGAVGSEQLSAEAVTSLTAAITASVTAMTSDLMSARSESLTYKTQAALAAAQASAAATDAANRAAAALSSQTASAANATSAQNALTSVQAAVANLNTQITNTLSDVEGSAGEAFLYAQLAGAWAEYMPGPLPPSVLAIMGITGEHWSARWWANQADQHAQDAEDAAAAAADFVARYLGAHSTAPTHDDHGAPLTAGALYYDLPTNAMRVWTGTVWRNVTVEYTATASPLVTNIAVDTSWWTFNGATTTFALKDFGGVSVTAGAASGCIVVLDGVIQPPSSFSISGTNIVFASAPPADTTAWMVAGVSLAGAGASGVSSFNTRTGNVTLTSTDVNTALGFTPASLDGTGKVPASQIPAIAISETYVVNSQSAMTALTAGIGDVAIRTDQSKSYILADTPASVSGNWKELLSPPDAVQSVNGQTGAVVIDLTPYLTTASAATTYETQSHASATYQPIASMSAYLTTASAYSTYETQSHAASTYQPIASMSDYLTTTAAASTYQTQSGMSAYLTTSSAASTYQTQSGMSSYLTTASAASTYATISSLAGITIDGGTY